MRSKILAGSVLLAATMAWTVSVGAVQQPDPKVAADAPAKMCGIWKLNKDISSTPAAPAALPGDSTGGSGGGGSGRGGRGGGRGGGGGGGRGGFGGGGGRGGASTSDTLQMHALMRETTDVPAQLTIVATAATVNFTDDQGRVRKFTTNDKKEKIDLGTAQIDTKSKWDADVLTQEMTGSRLKLLTTYQVTVEGHQMVVTMQLQGGGQTPAAPIKRIYDKVE